MPRKYPNEFRRKVLNLVESDRPVVEIAAQLGVSDQTIYNWNNQGQIDRGLRVGTTTVELAALSVAQRRPRELEIVLTMLHRANELLKNHSDPQGVGGSSGRSWARISRPRTPAAWSECRCRASTCGATARHQPRRYDTHCSSTSFARCTTRRVTPTAPDATTRNSLWVALSPSFAALASW